MTLDLDDTSYQRGYLVDNCRFGLQVGRGSHSANANGHQNPRSRVDQKKGLQMPEGMRRCFLGIDISDQAAPVEWVEQCASICQKFNYRGRRITPGPSIHATELVFAATPEEQMKVVSWIESKREAYIRAWRDLNLPEKTLLNRVAFFGKLEDAYVVYLAPPENVASLFSQWASMINREFFEQFPELYGRISNKPPVFHITLLKGRPFNAAQLIKELENIPYPEWHTQSFSLTCFYMGLVGDRYESFGGIRVDV